MPDEELYRRLNNELEEIYRTIQALAVNQHVFWEVQGIIKNNPTIQKPSTFYDWMGKMYIEAMTVAIRRLVDQTRGTVSFVRLLGEVKANLSCFSRAAYKSRCANPHVTEEYLDRDYDRLVGETRLEPNVDVIDAEIRELKKQTETLKQFVDEHVAHSAVIRIPDLPTFQDMDDAIKLLEKLLKRYLHLFRGAYLPRVLPTWTYDWKEIFTTPWIAEETHRVKPSDLPSPSEPPLSS